MRSIILVVVLLLAGIWIGTNLTVLVIKPIPIVAPAGATLVVDAIPGAGFLETPQSLCNRRRETNDPAANLPELCRAGVIAEMFAAGHQADIFVKLPYMEWLGKWAER